jgi:hypothetical protein
LHAARGLDGLPPIMIGWLSATVGYAIYLIGAHDLLLYVSGAAFPGYSIYQPMHRRLTQQVPPPAAASGSNPLASSARPWWHAWRRFDPYRWRCRNDRWPAS